MFNKYTTLVENGTFNSVNATEKKVSGTPSQNQEARTDLEGRQPVAIQEAPWYTQEQTFVHQA